MPGRSRLHARRSAAAGVGAVLCSLCVASCGGTGLGSTADHTHASSTSVTSPANVSDAQAFPALRGGTPCPRTPGGHATHHAEIITLGSGPVYPIMGFAAAPPAARGVLDLQQDGKRRSDGFWENKVLFAVSPRYTDAFTVEGRQIDGHNPLDWAIENGHAVPKLDLPGAPGWHYYPTSALLRGPGCYAVRLQGPSLSKELVFKVVNDSSLRRRSRAR